MLVIVDRSDSLVTVECNGCEYAGCVPTRELGERPSRDERAVW